MRCSVKTSQLMSLYSLFMVYCAYCCSFQALAFTPFTSTTKTLSRHRHDKTRLSLLVGEGAVFSTIESFFITQPYLSAFLTCSIKASAADFIAQTQQQQQQQQQQVSSFKNHNTFDSSRNLAFLLYGGLYQGMAQQFMYSTVFPDMFGYELDFTGLFCQVSFDMAVVGPFLCLPTAYVVKNIFATTSSSRRQLDDTNTTKRDTRLLQVTSTATAGSNAAAILPAPPLGLDKYIDDVMTKGLLFKYWSLWFPVNFLTFGVIAPHFRVAFVAAVSFFWVFILSSVAGNAGNKV